MANLALSRTGRLFVPALQCRHRSKFNTRRPKPGPWERRVFTEVTAPINAEMINLKWRDCDRIYQKEKVKERNLYEEFLVRQAKKIFEEHHMVLVCQLLSMPANDLRKVRNTFLNKGLDTRIYTNYIVNKAVEGTKWINIRPLLYSKNMYVVSGEAKLAECVNLTKRMADVWILGGFVGDRILTRNDIIEYAKLPSIELVRGQTVSTLNALAQRTYSLLNSHQQQLAANLEQYIKQGTDGSTSQSDSSSSDSDSDSPS